MHSLTIHLFLQPWCDPGESRSASAPHERELSLPLARFYSFFTFLQTKQLTKSLARSNTQPTPSPKPSPPTSLAPIPKTTSPTSQRVASSSSPTSSDTTPENT